MLLGKARAHFLKDNFEKLPKKALLRLIKDALGRNCSKPTLIKILLHLYSKKRFDPEVFKGKRER